MGLFDRMAASMGIQTAGNAEIIDVAAYARLPAEHPVVALADRAATRGLGATDMEMRQLFGDPMSAGSAAPVAPREATPARYNWVARRTLDQIRPRIGETHVDSRLPSEMRLAMAGVVADSIDPFGEAKASIVSTRMRDEAAMSRRIVGYLQGSSDEIAARGVDILRGASDEDLRAEFELVPGTDRRRIPRNESDREAWVDERLRTEHALARSGGLLAEGVIDASARLDMPSSQSSGAPLMARYRYDDIARDVQAEADDVSAMSDVDLRYRFMDLGGMGAAEIPRGRDRVEWVSAMMIEERQMGTLARTEREVLATERQAVDATVPPPPADPAKVRNIRISVAIGAIEAAGF